MAKQKKTVRVTLTLPDGSRKYFSGTTRREAEKKRAEAKVIIEKGYAVNDRTTFKAMSATWLKKYKARKNIALRTYETAEAIFNRYLIPFFGDRLLADIKPMDIDNLLIELQDLSLSTQKKCLQYTRNVFDMAIENELIPRSPTRDKKPTAEKAEKVHALTDSQCDALLSAMEGTRAYLFILVLLRCGLRKGEALGLMWDDIDFQKARMKVDRTLVYSVNNRAGIINPKMKTPAAHRIIPLAPDVLHTLQAAKFRSNSKYVFSMQDGSPLSESSFKRLWQLIDYRTIGGPNTSKRVEQVLDFHVHPHQLRHTCCTRWLADGLTPKEVQYLMGHETCDITMDIYAEYLQEQELEKTAEKICRKNECEVAV